MNDGDLEEKIKETESQSIEPASMKSKVLKSKCIKVYKNVNIGIGSYKIMWLSD